MSQGRRGLWPLLPDGIKPRRFADGGNAQPPWGSRAGSEAGRAENSDEQTDPRVLVNDYSKSKGRSDFCWRGPAFQ